MNAIFNSSLFRLLVLASVATISLWLFFSENNNTASQVTQEKARHESDYAMSDFTLTMMDQNGFPARRISGKEMAHYPQDDRTEIQLPVAHVIDDRADTWVISANHGLTHGQGEEITLTENVIITRTLNNEIELRTEKLVLDTQHNTAYTDLAVNIKSPHGGVTESVGLHAALQDKMINLHSRVKGHYNAPPSE